MRLLIPAPSTGRGGWARFAKYQNGKKEIMVLEVAALLKVEFSTENNKLFTLKLALEVILPSLNSPEPARA